MARGYPDFEGDKSKLYSVPEWAAYEATDKTFTTSDTDVAPDGSIFEEYEVDADKTLYISSVTFTATASAQADRDNNEMCELIIYKWAPAPTVAYCLMGGNGGGQVTFPKPPVIEGGQILRVYVYNRANHNLNLKLNALGHEV